MWAGLMLLGADGSGNVPDPKTTGDYIFLYGGLAIVFAAVLFLMVRAWLGRRRR
jgi:hypothetical protein